MLGKADMSSTFCRNKILVNAAVQSDFREGEAQTDPWIPKHRVVNGHPEVLTLDFMKYKKDLPAWIKTVDTIDFRRKKRAWENYLATIYSPEKSNFCKRIITDIEACEMKLLENDIDRTNKRRLELAAKQAEFINCEMDRRFKERDHFVSTQIAAKREKWIRGIKAKKTRELRKIDLKQRGVNMKYHNLTPIEEMCDPLSPFHVSVARFGKNPRYATEVLAKECQINNMKALRTVEKLLEKKKLTMTFEKKPGPKKHDCSQFKEDAELTTVPVNSVDRSQMNLQTSCGGEESIYSNALTFLSPHQEKDYQAVLLLQTLIRGRAVQNLMYTGRKKNQALIDESQSTFAFFNEEENEVDIRRRRALQSLRYYHLNMKLIGLVAHVQESIISEGVADIVLRAQQELETMTEESRAHLMAQLAEKTRWHRETAEAGRRQRELRRRDLYDEFFKHLSRRNEITSQFYIQLIQDRVIRMVAEKEADISTKHKADEIEKQDIEDARRKKHDIVERREMMARLLHNHYVPQISKNLQRFGLDYYIGKARKTAIDVITERAKKYAAKSKEAALLEPVLKAGGDPSGVFSTVSPSFAGKLDDTISPEVFEEGDDDESVEFNQRVESLERFMKQDTMSLIKEAEEDYQTAEMYKNAIMKNLRAQEEEKFKILKKSDKVPSNETAECYKNTYTTDGILPMQKTISERLSRSDDWEEEQVGEDFGERDDSSSSGSPVPLDFIDRRLMISSDEKATTDSDWSEDEKCKQKLQDMPERVVDELLHQAEVRRQQEIKHSELIKAAMRPDSESVVSSESYTFNEPEDEDEDEAKDEYETHSAEEAETKSEMILRKYQHWRDQSDFSAIDWGYKEDTGRSSELGHDLYSIVEEEEDNNEVASSPELNKTDGDEEGLIAEVGEKDEEEDYEEYEGSSEW